MRSQLCKGIRKKFWRDRGKRKYKDREVRVSMCLRKRWNSDVTIVSKGKRIPRQNKR